MSASPSAQCTVTDDDQIYGLVVLALRSGAVISAVLVAIAARTFAFIFLAPPMVCIPSF